MQVVTSPCCPRQLPDVISNSLFLDAGSPTPAVHRVLAPVSSTVPSAFPKGKVGRLPAAIPLETTSCGGTFEVADISLCSGLQVCSPPRSSLPLRILPQGSRGFYVRAERGSLPPRASDMLTARRQAIGGAGTCTPLDCGLVGCSFPSSPLKFRTVGFPQSGFKAGLSDRTFLDVALLKPSTRPSQCCSKFDLSFVRSAADIASRFRAPAYSALHTHRHAHGRFCRVTPGVLALVRCCRFRSVIA